VSRSPRKNIKRADEALRQVLETAERFPQAKAELLARLGEHHYAELVRAAAIVRGAAEVMDTPNSTPGVARKPSD
jgi:hypothetical protein